MAISLNAFAQIGDADFFVLEREMRGVRKITEKSYTAPHLGYWKSVFYYDENGFLLRQVNYNKRKKWQVYSMRADYRYEYSISDTLLVIKEEEVQNINNNPKVHTIRKFYYNDLKRCYKYEIYSSNHPLNNLGKPNIVGDNFIYKDGLLQSFDGHSFRWRVDSSDFNRIASFHRRTYTYDDNQRIERTYHRTHIDSAFISGSTYTSIYENGKRIDLIQESSNEREVLLGVPSWSSERTNKMQIRFSDFDKHGNWTRSYFITERGKVFRSERKIEYW
ncbi:MAG: hypothetical protein LBH22_03750 [Bacteroidales bacterium]|jgi:hypothetical protein|nr:hypothetical protein [Bacteroidales bacterium]